MEDKGKREEARGDHYSTWNEAANDFEKFPAGYYVARHQNNFSDKLKWLETALQLGFKIITDSVNRLFLLYI